MPFLDLCFLHGGVESCHDSFSLSIIPGNNFHYCNFGDPFALDASLTKLSAY